MSTDSNSADAIAVALLRLRNAVDRAIFATESGDEILLIACAAELDSAANAAKALRRQARVAA